MLLKNEKQGVYKTKKQAALHTHELVLVSFLFLAAFFLLLGF